MEIKVDFPKIKTPIYKSGKLFAVITTELPRIIGDDVFSQRVNTFYQKLFEKYISEAKHFAENFSESFIRPASLNVTCKLSSSEEGAFKIERSSTLTIYLFRECKKKCFSETDSFDIELGTLIPEKKEKRKKRLKA